MCVILGPRVRLDAHNLGSESVVKTCVHGDSGSESETGSGVYCFERESGVVWSVYGLETGSAVHRRGSQFESHEGCLIYALVVPIRVDQATPFQGLTITAHSLLGKTCRDD